jgi:tetratricopeptide (TPR) repeat protein
MTAFLVISSVQIAHERRVAAAALRQANAFMALSRNNMVIWDARYQFEIAVRLAQMNRREAALGRFNQGRQTLEAYCKSFAQQREVADYPDVEHLNLLLSLQTNCEALHDAGMVDESAAILRDVLSELRKYDAAAARSVWIITSHAWILAMWPNPEVRDCREALRLAERAMLIDLDPGHYMQWFRWGVLAYAHMRCGHWQEAIDAIQKSDEIRLAQGSTVGSLDYLLLALAHWKLGRKEEAREWFKTSQMQDDRLQFLDGHFAREVAQAMNMTLPPPGERVDGASP